MEDVLPSFMATPDTEKKNTKTPPIGGRGPF